MYLKWRSCRSSQPFPRRDAISSDRAKKSSALIVGFPLSFKDSALQDRILVSCRMQWGNAYCDQLDRTNRIFADEWFLAKPIKFIQNVANTILSRQIDNLTTTFRRDLWRTPSSLRAKSWKWKAGRSECSQCHANHSRKVAVTLTHVQG